MQGFSHIKSIEEFFELLSGKGLVLHFYSYEVDQLADVAENSLIFSPVWASVYPELFAGFAYCVAAQNHTSVKR